VYLRGMLRYLFLLPLLVSSVASAPIDLLARPGPRGPEVVLALSGGGARGLAQIGVIRALDEAGVPVCGVAGVSMGAIVGALYAAGYNPDSIAALVEDMDRFDVLSNTPPREARFLTQREEHGALVTVRFRDGRPVIPKGLIGGQRIADLLSDLLASPSYRAGCDFKRLPRRLAVVATDLTSGKSVNITNGDLPEAARASSSFPLVFEPVRREGRLLVDGGMLQPIPVSAARGLGGDVVVAVDVTSKLVGTEEIDDPFEIVNQVTTISQLRAIDEARASADFVITPNLCGFSNTDFARASELIEIGERAGRLAVPGITELLRTRGLHPVPPPPRPALTIDRIVLDGASVFPLETLLFHAELAEGLSVPRAVLAARCERIVEPYHEADYPLARVTSAAFDDGLLSISIDEGRIASVEVVGVRRTRSWVVRRLMNLQKGGLYRHADVLAGRRALEGAGLFPIVTIEPRPTPFGAAVTIRVVEKPYTFLGLGWRYTDDGGHDVMLELGDDNFLGIAYLGRLRMVLGQHRRFFAVQHRADRLWKGLLTSTFEVYAGSWVHDYYEDDEIVDTWEHRRAGASVAIGQQVGYLGRLALTCRHEWASLDLPRSTQQRFVKGEIALEYAYSALDRDIYPRGGARQSFVLRLADEDVWGDLSYTLMDLRSDLYFSIVPVTLEPSVRLGLSTGSVPFSEQFTVGGRATLMGVGEEAYRGDKALALRAGLRVELGPRVYGLFRFDAADVWHHADELTLRGLHRGVGVGLAWDSPVGPAEVLVGVADESRARLHAQAGWTF
jgi:predicted acylesterase/phospholipase RssA